MKLIIGLGNVGKGYERTRHNVGFEVVNRLGVLSWKKSEKLEAEVAKIDDLILAKPLTFMNNSGRAVKKLVDFYKVEMSDLWVIHDDLDIALGEYKIQMGVGPKVHNGVTSAEEALGREDFWRVRVGIENRGEKRVKGEEYVLSDFEKEEEIKMSKVVGKVVDEILEAVRG